MNERKGNNNCDILVSGKTKKELWMECLVTLSFYYWPIWRTTESRSIHRKKRCDSYHQDKSFVRALANTFMVVNHMIHGEGKQ